MSKPKKGISAIVRGAGLLTSIFSELMKAVYKLGGTDEDIHTLVTPEGEPIIREMARLIVENYGGIFPIDIDYSKNLEGMIRSGNYDWVYPRINKTNFPIIKEGAENSIEIVLVRIRVECRIDSGLALNELARRGFRPITLPELLAFGEKYPDKQREFPIVALGSVWNGSFNSQNMSPLLTEDNGRRTLNLNWGSSNDVYWDDECRFAAVRK